MIPYSGTMLQRATRMGIAPVNLFDIQTPSGDLYYWADRNITASSIITADGNPASNAYSPWILSVDDLQFYRSLQSDTGKFTIQNLSGDSLSRDFEKIARRSVLEGSFFVYRYYDAAAQDSWIEKHGTLSVNNIDFDTAVLTMLPVINASQEDTPLEIFSESCQLIWGQKRCGATGDQECLYSYETCQVTPHIMVVLNNYEKNYGEAYASLASTNIVRRRRI